MTYWTPEQDEKLKRFADEGLSASEIAGRMRISRNAVIGRAHRIMIKTDCQRRGRYTNGRLVPHWTADEDELLRSSMSTREIAAKLGRSKGAILRRAYHLQISRMIVRPTPEPKVHAPKARPRRAPAPSVAALPPEPLPPVGSKTLVDLPATLTACRWPYGEPRSPEFRFCGQRSRDGHPYCDAHERVAYRPLGSMRA